MRIAGAIYIDADRILFVLQATGAVKFVYITKEEVLIYYLRLKKFY